MSRPISAWALTGTLTFMGIAHFAVPDLFDAIVPPWLPGTARPWTWLSGAAELAVAGLVAWPRTRRLGGLSAVALFLSVFPANVQMALDADGVADRVIAYARLPLQVPLVLWALAVHRRAKATQPT